MARTAKISKNIWNLAIPAVSLSLANRYEFIADIFIDAIKRIPAIHFFGNVAVCQNKGVRSLFIHTNQLFLAKWQTAEQKVSTRRTVTSIRYLSTFSRATLQSNLHTQPVRSMQPMHSALRYSHAASSICASVSTSNQSSCHHRNAVEVMKTTDIRTLFRKAEKPMSIAYISKRTGMTVEECENRICDLAATCDAFAIVCKVMSRRRRFSRLREFFGLCGYEYAPAYYLLKRNDNKIR